ncbi:acetyl-CoA acetyltransferase [Oceanicola sp. 22II-s10i]|uniref:acetyl-CoA C-acetyltransferase n=1 Tax=Oceanicola sp. 22II-s10i TaxID=1317116 RepID=UPI000B522EDC|nr:acetyl-CoA C-acetyltransferase [Oceanicola sp. 22II-s10i]OWU83783.1 acetyl-CoA acetyltransferase [Oceanicola sp. 22II-s10i]
MPEAFIYDAVRTPRGKGRAGGGLNSIPPIDLTVTALNAIRDRNALDTALVDDVVMGCVAPLGEQGADIARVSALRAGYAETVPGTQINRFCASGLEACNLAAAQVMSGQADFSIGGGVESMSRIPMGSSGGPWTTDPDVATDLHYAPQGIGADTIATIWGYSRTDVDSLALESQKRAKTAWDEGRFANSVIPVHDMHGIKVLDRDEHMRPQTTMQSLASIDPAFAVMGKKAGYDNIVLRKYPELASINHVHHAGNASGIVDGAAAVLIGSKEAGEAASLKPRARIRAFASVGSEPTIMLTGPSYAAEKALKRAGMTAADIDLWEVNEAFASVVLRFMEAMGTDASNTNVNGGAIAMGHPLGATGAMLLGTVLDELERTGKSTALITLCVAQGMGTATIIERV